MGGPWRKLTLRPGKPGPFYETRPKLTLGDVDKGIRLLDGYFDYAGQSIDVGRQGEPWTIALPSERFAFWLHGFEWLADLDALNETAAAVRGRYLVDRWIETYGDWNSYAWKPDAVTHRLYAWLSLWSPLLSLDKLTSPAQVRRANAVRQLKYLRRTYNRTTPGITRFKAAVVLVIGGARIAEKADGYLDRGLDWLDDEISAQILPDGGHVSRSPTQTLKALELLITLDQILQIRGVEGTRSMNRAMDRLPPLIPFFTASDGGVVSFHGSGEKNADQVKTITKYAVGNSKPFGSCPHTGFQRIDQNGSVIVMDTGGSPDHPYDVEAHLSPLAFELSSGKDRLIVNCGWSRQQQMKWRQPIRETVAHSTLTLDNKSAGKIITDGKLADIVGCAITKDAGPVQSVRKQQPEGVWLEATHEGYVPDTGLAHRRRLYVREDGKDIRGEDSLAVPQGQAPVRNDEVPFHIRFHLHPDVRVTLAQDQKSALLITKNNTGWRFRTDTGPLAIETSTYLGRREKPEKSEQIVIKGQAFCGSDGTTTSNRVKWSIRRLEAKQ